MNWEESREAILKKSKFVKASDRGLVECLISLVDSLVAMSKRLDALEARADMSRPLV